jgi:hypothetical protein
MSATNNNNGWRHPKTTSERRQGYDEEHAPYIRGVRKPNRLVNAYDDIPVNERGEKSWKSKRKDQYLDKDCKFYHLEIFVENGLTVYENCRRIERHLEQLDYSYKRLFKMLDGNLLAIIEFRGKHIGDWKGCKYL